MEELVQELIAAGHLKTPRIIEAFRRVDRADFMPQDMKGFAYANEALPIGSGQTISQPMVVAFMLELLGPREGERVLDIGAGSGWTSCLLSAIVGEQGRVVALEVLPELASFARENAAKYTFLEAGVLDILQSQGATGYPPEAPFDRILASASLSQKQLPPAWAEQLKASGVLVVPIQNSIWRFQKQEDGTLQEQEYPGFVFVPLV